ncbi:MAG: potassium transporter TrkA [Gammaproteobacteria bacterium]|nr:potassium transporter TrkA [Gammaproteobacteria bacterium]
MSNEEAGKQETSEETISPVFSMIMSRMRAPLILLIIVYAVAMVGLILIPGVDDEGKLWRMSIFHAFYYVSFTATTIGFGEIPYALNDAQRLWVICTIYMTVIAWLYAIGKILSLVQDPVFKKALYENRFKNQVSQIHEPFYLVCGLGETGYDVIKALTDEHYRAIVIEKDQASLLENNIHDLREFVPCLIADASVPRYLKLAGISRDYCKGVIAATASDETNLKIAISSKLLHPEGKVVCRSDIQVFEENMLSFNTDYVVNPYRTFADIFSMLLHSSSLHLIFDWITGAPDSQLSIEPLNPRYGRWILCSYGRFGNALYQKFLEHDIALTILEPDEEVCETFRKNNIDQAQDIIVGTGIDEKSLKKAGIDDAVGIIAGWDNDSNNLSIVMTARQLNPDIFVVARQNLRDNSELFVKSKADLVMQPREITARMIRALFLNPLLIEYLNNAKKQDEEWSNIVISRLSAVVGDKKPHIWTAEINTKQAPAIINALNLGRNTTLNYLTQDPVSRDHKLKCVALLIERQGDYQMMPDDSTKIEIGDRILFCGKREDMNSMHWILHVMSSLNYVMNYRDEAESYIWRKLTQKNKGVERRKTQR